MGTKQLMADRRVAEVTLNEAGKAATLTLAPGFLFEGSRGPFTLKNVEHGHQIVRGAESDGSGTKVRAKRATPVAKEPSWEPGGVDRPAAPPPVPLAPRGHVEACYRIVLVPKGEEPKGEGREYCGWLKVPNPLTPKELRERTWSMLRPYLQGASEETHEPASKQWTNKDQAAARKRGELGAPWKDANYG